MSDNPFLDLAGISQPPGAPPAAGPTAAQSPLNNPGNLKPGYDRNGKARIAYPGQTGVDRRGIAIFDSPQAGRTAGISQLQRYQRRAGRPLTFLEIAQTYAPVGDGKNDPQAYARSTSSAFGKAPTDTIDVSDPTNAERLFDAHVAVEQGTPLPKYGDAGDGAPPLSGVAVNGAAPNAFLDLAGLNPTANPSASPAPSGVSPGIAEPNVNNFLSTPVGGGETPTQAPKSAPIDLRAAASGALNSAASLDPLTDALVHGNGHALDRFATNVQDASAGLISGAARVPETLLRGGAWALDNVAAPVSSFLGGGTHGISNVSKTISSLADNLEGGAASLAHDPKSGIYKSREIVGDALATLPAFELKPLEAIPALGEAVNARRIAKAAGDVGPLNERLAAALVRSGDMALGGAAGGAIGSGGHDVAASTLSGAVLAPAAGAVAERVIAPLATRVANSGAAKAIGDVLSRRTSAAQKILPTANSDLPPLANGATIRTGDQLATRAGATEIASQDLAAQSAPHFKDAAELAAFRHDFYPNKADLSDQEFLDWFGRSRSAPATATVDGNQLPAIHPSALGSAGARNGIEATTDLPPQVADHVRQLTSQGVPLDQALREADITHAGADPTLAAVTRDASHQRAMNEGAKLDTPEGRALADQMARNNGALTQRMQGMVAKYGGTPQPGEVAESVAQSLADASDAEYGHVRSLYDAADAESVGASSVADDHHVDVVKAYNAVTARQAQDAARAELNAAQQAMKTARSSPESGGSGDLAAARARVEQARAKLRDVTVNPPLATSLPDSRSASGYIDLSGLRTALNAPEMANPTVEGAKTLRSGVLGLMDAYGGGSDRFTASQAERIRQALNDAYEPTGGAINAQVGRLKASLDQALDSVDAGSKYRAAREAHKAWASKYENPAGIEKLIRRNTRGQFAQQDNWRRTEQGLVGSLNDRDLIQVARQLKENGDTKSLNRLKATVLQRAFNSAAKGATDTGGNALISGDHWFDALNQIGSPKLNALFDRQELAHIASIGRAARALNSPVPGTVNASGTASALINRDIGGRLVTGVRHGKSGNSHGVAVHAGASMLGGAAALLGHGVAGPVVGAAVSGAKLLTDAMSKGAQRRLLAEALTDAANPAAARQAAKMRTERLAEGLVRAEHAATVGRPTQSTLVAASQHKLAEALRAHAVKAQAQQ